MVDDLAAIAVEQALLLVRSLVASCSLPFRNRSFRDQRSNLVQKFASRLVDRDPCLPLVLPVASPLALAH